MTDATVIALSALVVFVSLLVIIARFSRPGGEHEPEYRAAGRRGERSAARVISSVLRPDEVMLKNLRISYGEKDAELDITVVNKYGVFVIEVKNYSGVLYGGKDDRKWTKKHVSRGGSVFVKPVTNPLRQVKREVDILARYLRYHGFDVWVEGYAFIWGAESPVRSERIIEDEKDAARALHTPGRRRLTPADIKGIRELLEQ